MSKLFTTMSDAISQEIAPAFVGAEFGGREYNLGAIAREVMDFDTAEDADGIVHLNQQGFRLDEDVDFWEVAARHERRVYIATLGLEAITISDPESADADMVIVDGQPMAAILLYDATEEWEPETYEAVLTDAGWEMLDEWQADGDDYTAHVVHI